MLNGDASLFTWGIGLLVPGVLLPSGVCTPGLARGYCPFVELTCLTGLDIKLLGLATGLFIFDIFFGDLTDTDFIDELIFEIGWVILVWPPDCWLVEIYPFGTP